MPQNTKDSQGGKNKPVKDTRANGGGRVLVEVIGSERQLHLSI